MYRLILVPVDGTRISQRALSLATRLAQQTTAHLHLVRVHVPTLYVYLGRFCLGGIPTQHLDLDDTIRHDEQLYLETLQERVIRTTHIPVTTELCDGEVVAALLHEIELSHADVVVLARHPRKYIFSRWSHGVAQKITQQSHIPVLCVSPDGKVRCEQSPELQATADQLIHMKISTLA